MPGSKRRIDAPDTIDEAIHALSKLQVEGWGLSKMTRSIEYRKLGHKKRKLPVRSTLVIELVPFD